MAKIVVDIDHIKESLESIGYIINECVERNNNGKNWQIKFSNSGAIVTIYDSNNVNNSVVNGKSEDNEKAVLKAIVDGLKSGELEVEPLNKKIVELIRERREEDYFDFKIIPHKDKESLIHDILCLSNNLENKDGYLIIGVDDNTYEVVGIAPNEFKSNDVFDFLKSLRFSGGHIPNVEIKRLRYKFKEIVVIICKASNNVPFYLEERYQGINSHQIYTRVGDTNTPKNQHASYEDVERLWRIHIEAGKK